MSATPARPVDMRGADGHHFTDAGNAGRLVELAAGRLRYVRTWGKWLAYVGGRWVLDMGDTLVTEVAKGVPSRMLVVAAGLRGDPRVELVKYAIRSEGDAYIRAMIHLARGAPGMTVEHDELDAHEHLLNVANGTVDLRDGRLRPHDPADLLTLQVPYRYDPTARSELWLTCLQRWQPDPAVQDYLQRAVGSGATGRPVHRLFVNVGGGGNGKSLFFGCVGDTLGPYFVVPHKSLFVTERHEGHPTRLASLFGARLIVAPETSEGDRLDEEQIKALTGGDVLTARRMREDEWRFRPSHTAFLHTNHVPRIRGTDEGIWRRIRLVPWLTSITDAERDEHLDTKLANERTGILSWIVAGSIAFYAHGLTEPASVRDATAQYRANSDPVGRFLAERARQAPTGKVGGQALYAAWARWCRDVDEEPLGMVEFAGRLGEKGISKKRTSLGIVYLGVELADTDSGSV